MFIFQDSNGTNHAIEGAESMRKAMSLPCGARQIVVSDEQGQLVSLGNNADQIARNGQLIKSYYDGEALAKAVNSDDKKIQQAVRHHDKMTEVKKILLIDKTVVKQAIKQKSKPMAKSHSNINKLLGDLQAYKTSVGLI